ncbi:MAG: ribokinase [Candidatus Izemoplasmatales bacterium]
MTLYVIGSINMDLYIQIDKMPQIGETRLGSHFLATPGGKGANQAVAVQKSGGKAVMVGCIGGEFGQDLREAFISAGVDMQNVTMIPDISSGLAIIIIEGNNNRILIDPGANCQVTKALIDQALEAALPGDILLTQLEIPLEMVCYALECAKKKRMTTFLNPAPALALPDSVFLNVDYLLPNQTEAAFYTGIYPIQEDSIRACAFQLLKKGVKNVLITLGESGSWLFGEKEVRMGIYPINVVDTTAAGDTFIGAFAAKLASGWLEEDAMRYAAKAASITLSRQGAQKAIPTEAEVTAVEGKE